MQLSPEQINEFLAKAVLESQIGDAVKASIKRVTDELSKSYNNPFDEVIKRHVNNLIDAELLATYRPTLEAGIQKAMASYMTEDVMDKIVTAALEKLRRNGY
jgi:uncharacterized membrane-anchored protein YjiN (DUF445 family)